MSETTPTTINRRGRTMGLRRSLAGVLALVPVAVVAISGAVLMPRIGPILATHWSGFGAPDGFGGTAGTFWIVGAIVAALSVGSIAVLALVRDGAIARFSCAIAVAIAGILAVAWLALAVAAAAAARPEDARLGGSLLLIIPAFALGAAVLALVPRGERVQRGSDAVSPLPLRPGERVAWVGSAGSRAFLIGGILVALACVAAAVVTLNSGLSGADSGSGIAAVAGVLASLAVIALARVRLFVDSRGVRLVSVLFGIPLMRIRLSDVTAVRVETIDPMRWGGWGYRFSPAGRAYVTARGPGIVVTTRNGRASAVTIANPEGAASVLKALLTR